MDKRIFSVVGKPGSGKTYLVEKASEAEDVSALYVSSILKKEVKKQGFDWTPENAHKIGETLVLKNPDYFGKLLGNMVQSDPCQYLIIDGIKSSREIDYLENRFTGNFKIVAVLVPENIRMSRILERYREQGRADILTIEDLQKRQDREHKYGLDNVISSADYQLKNWDAPFEEILEQFKSIIYDHQ